MLSKFQIFGTKTEDQASTNTTIKYRYKKIRVQILNHTTHICQSKLTHKQKQRSCPESSTRSQIQVKTHYNRNPY